MNLVKRLYVAFGMLLAIALFSAALVIWSAREANFYLERSYLAHRVYEGFLLLSNNTYQLFKQFGDAMLVGDQDLGAGETELVAKIREDITNIRSLIGQEIELVGEEEIEELDRLAAIERQIESLLSEYTNLVNNSDAAGFPNDWGRLSHVLNEKVDRDFNAMIDEAVADEAEEVRETREETAERIALLRILALVFSLIAIVSAVASLALLVRDIRRPIDKLLAGARAFATGNLDHRIGAYGKGELEDVGRAFNHMADEIEAREKELSQSNVQLEQAVADRTAELERVLDRLKANEDNRKRLMADVSHELRTPLTIIRGEADIALRKGDKPPEVYRQALEKTREAAMHTAGIVDDLLFVARREAGETRLKLEAVDLAKLLPRIVEQHAAVAKQHNAKIRFASDVVRSTNSR